MERITPIFYTLKNKDKTQYNTSFFKKGVIMVILII